MEDLRNKFIDYLKLKKNFPKESFLKDAYIVDIVGKDSKKKMLTDLAILDVDNNNYLALIEFKESFKEISEHQKFIYDRYLTVLNQQGLSFYFIIPSDNSFRIYILKEAEFLIVEHDDFPDYKTLLSKVLTEKKRTLISDIVQDSKEKNKKKEVFATTLAATVVSLITALLISNSFLKDNLFNSDDDEIKKLELTNKELFNRIKSISNQMIIIDSIKKDTINKSQIILTKLDSRLTSIEKLIDKNPKNLMQSQDINYRLNNLNTIIEKDKEYYNVKIQNVEDKLNTYITIIFTLVVTIIGSLTAFTISTFKK